MEIDMTQITISDRGQNTPPSPIRKLAHLANKAEKSGVHVYYLNIGQPDIESPREFFDGLRYFNDKVVAYERSQGSEDLSIAWSKYINRTLDLNTSPEQFLITVGASEALVFLFMTCCDPGDEVIIFDPTYANYLGFGSISGTNLVPVLCNMDNNFALPPRNEIEQKITNRTRAILIVDNCPAFCLLKSADRADRYACSFLAVHTAYLGKKPVNAVLFLKFLKLDQRPRF